MKMLKFLCLAAGLLTVVIDAQCTKYMRIVSGKCADICLGKRVGWCPISIVVKFGKLKKASCAGMGFTQNTGTTTTQKAGPCGKMKFKIYEQGCAVSFHNRFCRWVQQHSFAYAHAFTGRPQQTNKQINNTAYDTEIHIFVALITPSHDYDRHDYDRHDYDRSCCPQPWPSNNARLLFDLSCASLRPMSPKSALTSYKTVCDASQIKAVACAQQRSI